MAEQLTTPLEKIEKLTPFEGRPVIATAIEIPGAGGGLRDALTIDPQEFHYGETVFVVIEGKVGKLRFDPVKDAGDGVKRVHVLDTQAATVAERATVEALLEAQARRIEEAKGLQRLPFGDELQEAHDRGEHADGLVDGCPDCDLETDLEAKEAGDGDGEAES
jgi:hypothetical protein